MNLNKALIVGRVTATPELRKTPAGQSVSAFSVATNRTWTDKAGARQEDTEFHNVVVWGRQAEIASQFLVKGSMVLVEGRLKTRSWADKQGANHKTTEIICERFQLGPRPQGQGGQGGYTQPTAPAMAPQESKEEFHEEIPVINMEEDGAGEIKSDEVPF